MQLSTAAVTDNQICLFHSELKLVQREKRRILTVPWMEIPVMAGLDEDAIMLKDLAACKRIYGIQQTRKFLRRIAHGYEDHCKIPP